MQSRAQNSLGPGTPALLPLLLSPASLFSPGGFTSARRKVWERGGGATPQREDTSSPPPSISLLGKLRPRAESDLQRSRPGPWGSELPPQRSGPAGGVERVPASQGVPQRLTKAQTHLGSHAGSPRPAQRGSGGCGRPGGPAPILVGGRCAPRSRAAPRRAHFPPRARARRRPAGLPSRHPPGGSAPGGPWRLLGVPGRSDRLGRPSWPARLSHSAGPTLPRLFRILAGFGSLPQHTHPYPSPTLVMPILHVESEAQGSRNRSGKE